MGKTTLLRTVMGYLTARGGSVRMLGAEVTAEPVHKRARLGVAYTPQEKALFQDLSVADNLRLGLADDREFAAAMERVRAVFPFFGDRMRQPAGTLSGGEQKMLLLARSLAADPRLMLVDEVTEGLQPSVVDHVAGILRTARDRDGRAVLLVEQHVRFALTVADRFAVLTRGQVVAEGLASDPSARAMIEDHLRV